MRSIVILPFFQFCHGDIFLHNKRLDDQPSLSSVVSYLKCTHSHSIFHCVLFKVYPLALYLRSSLCCYKYYNRYSALCQACRMLFSSYSATALLLLILDTLLLFIICPPKSRGLSLNSPQNLFQFPLTVGFTAFSIPTHSRVHCFIQFPLER